ncbi:MAG: nucleoside transporter [Micrococcales bacterium]|nr:MAG: nucleoside transporter [Micrococcales bacterium]
MFALLGIAYLASTNRKAIKLRTVGAAFALQVIFGVIVLYWEAGQRGLQTATQAVQAVINSSDKGITFLFGPVLPETGLVFAFQVLPVIVFFASLTSVLYYLGVLQKVVEGLGGALQRLLGTSRAESVNAAANVFVGQTEAPLVIKPYIKNLTHSSLFAVMVGGLSTVAGSVLVGYSLLGAKLEYLIAASFMAAPGALLMAKMIMPETEDISHELEVDTGRAHESHAEKKHESASHGESKEGTAAAESAATAATATATADETGDGAATDTGKITGAEKTADDAEEEEGEHRNVIDAAAAGAAEGLQLALNIGGMLLAFISLIALLNLIIGGVGGWFGADDLTFEQILGWLFAPVMFVIGVPWDEAIRAGSFIGQKIVVNEFVAFSKFGPVASEFTPKTTAIITFGLTGFANLGSLGILLGGLGGLAPNRRGDIARFGLRAILAATLANLMSAAIAGILIG